MDHHAAVAPAASTSEQAIAAEPVIVIAAGASKSIQARATRVVEVQAEVSKAVQKGGRERSARGKTGSRPVGSV